MVKINQKLYYENKSCILCFILCNVILPYHVFVWRARAQNKYRKSTNIEREEVEFEKLEK